VPPIFIATHLPIPLVRNGPWAVSSLWRRGRPTGVRPGVRSCAEADSAETERECSALVRTAPVDESAQLGRPNVAVQDLTPRLLGPFHCCRGAAPQPGSDLALIHPLSLTGTRVYLLSAVSSRSRHQNVASGTFVTESAQICGNARSDPGCHDPGPHGLVGLPPS
jgi:hypothetical protein